jgi:hypothetical protein
MGWRPFLLALVVVLVPARAHAQSTPEEHTVQELELKARSHIVTGSLLTSFGGALMVVGGGLIGAQYAYTCEDCGPSAPTFLIIGASLLGIGGLNLVPGAVLLDSGIRKKKSAALLASGKVGLDVVGEAEYLGPVTAEGTSGPPGPGTGDATSLYAEQRMGKVKRMANTGYVLVSLSLAFAAASWCFLAGHLARGLYDSYSLDVGFFVLTPASMVLFAIGSPHLLLANTRARHLEGLKPTDGLNTAGWVLYAPALATGSLFFGGWPPYIAMAYSALLVTGSAVSIAAGVRATRTADRYVGEQPHAFTLVPSVAPLAGGFVLGIAGTW